MKKRMYSAITLSLIIGSVTLFSCGSETESKSTPTETTEAVVEEETPEEVVEESAAISGEELFSSSGCVACHQVDTKTVGPSLQEIATAYKDNKSGLISFLKEEGEAIVDPAQAAVMAPQLATTKAMASEELDAIANHMLNN